MLTYSDQKKNRDTSQVTINVDRNGRPYAQLWTWRGIKHERHPWHVKLAADMHSHKIFYSEDGGLRAAKAYLETLAQ